MSSTFASRDVCGWRQPLLLLLTRLRPSPGPRRWSPSRCPSCWQSPEAAERWGRGWRSSRSPLGYVRGPMGAVWQLHTSHRGRRRSMWTVCGSQLPLDLSLLLTSLSVAVLGSLMCVAFIPIYHRGDNKKYILFERILLNILLNVYKYYFL